MRYQSISMFIFLVVAFVGDVRGQTDTTFAGNRRRALLFQLDDSFRLTSFEGGTISIKRQVSKKEYRRIGLSMSGRHAFADDLYYDSLPHVSKGQESFANVGIRLSRQYYLNPDDNVRVYSGFGIGIQFDHSWSDRRNANSFLGDEITSGPIVDIGVEWMFRERISISGEYGSQVYYSYLYQRFKFSGHKDVKLRTHTFGLRQNPVKLGLSAYF